MLKGTLRTNNLRQQLYFLDNDNLKNLETSVTTNKPIILIIKDNNSYYRIKTVVSTLPVLNVDGVESYIDEEGRMNYSGKMSLFAGCDPETNNYSLKTSNLDYHIRGNSSIYMNKKSYKFSLKNNNNQKKNKNLLNLGSDDDWILNSMSMDDTKIREKIAQDLWNNNLDNMSEKYKMSTGEYVEMVLNGQYMGLYLLQRRLDKKYLNLSDSDILLKGGTMWGDDSYPQGAYEIKHSIYSDEYTYDLYKKMYYEVYKEDNINNYINNELFISILSAADNSGNKNMYCILDLKGNTLNVIMWDTDYSMGITWIDGRCYDYEYSNKATVHRKEYPIFSSRVSEIDNKIKNKWKYLRKNMYSKDNVNLLIDETINIINKSCSYQRDIEQWGLIDNGIDKQENIKKWIKDRIDYLDSYYDK